jgi:hypothetical protein
MRMTLVRLSLLALFMLAPVLAHADDYVLTIKGHTFTPAELKVPADKRIIITVVNSDPTPEEFESRVLKVEKVIPGNSKAIVRVGPLKAGRYPFVGEFHEATAKGVLIAE